MDIDSVIRVAQSVHNLATHRSKTPMLLVSCIVNDAMVHTTINLQQVMLHLVNVVHPQLINWLLDVLC